MTKRLLVAPIEIGGKLSTAELIDKAGRKSAIAGGTKAHGYWKAQPLPENNMKEFVLLIGEGIATVLSAQEATGYAAIAMYEKYPTARLIMLANIGKRQAKAKETAKATGATLAAPDFTGIDTSDNPTDFNDLHRLAGLAAVQAQISASENLPAEKIPREQKNISENENNPTLPTLSSNDKALSQHHNLHQTYTSKPDPTLNPTPEEKTTIKPGIFVYLNDDGKPYRMIESMEQHAAFPDVKNLEGLVPIIACQKPGRACVDPVNPKKHGPFYQLSYSH